MNIYIGFALASFPQCCMSHYTLRTTMTSVGGIDGGNGRACAKEKSNACGFDFAEARLRVPRNLNFGFLLPLFLSQELWSLWLGTVGGGLYLGSLATWCYTHTHTLVQLLCIHQRLLKNN